jgi:hypothetical protein
MGRDRCGIEDRERRQASWERAAITISWWCSRFFFRFLTLLFTQRMDGLSGMSGLMGSAASDRNGMAAHSDQQRATSKFATKRSFVASRDSIHLPETRTTARWPKWYDVGCFSCEREQKTNAGAIILISRAVVSLFSLSFLGKLDQKGDSATSRLVRLIEVTSSTYNNRSTDHHGWPTTWTSSLPLSLHASPPPEIPNIISTRAMSVLTLLEIDKLPTGRLQDPFGSKRAEWLK